MSTFNFDHGIPLPPTGDQLNCKGWHQEAALRCLLNNLHPEVAEDRDELIVYGGNGQAARNMPALKNIIQTLLKLENDQTLLIQSGKPVAVFPSNPEGPRVLLANSNLVPKWATWEHFNHLKNQGLMMYGQMTAGSWIYIGSQGILQGTYETFMAAAKKHFDQLGLKNRLVISCGLGGMGGAQPLAVKIGGGVFLGCDVNKERILKRVQTGYLDQLCDSIDEAIELALEKKQKGEAYSIGLSMNATDFLQKVIDRKLVPDLLTDQTSAHDPLNGYVPDGMGFNEAMTFKNSDPNHYQERSYSTMRKHVELMLQLKNMGAYTFDYGNNLREGAKIAGLENAFDFPGFVPAYIRDLFCHGSGPFRWIALSGDPEDIYTTDQTLKELFPENTSLINWLDNAKKHIQFQGLPSRICWLKYGDREKAGLAFNKLVREKKVKAPIIIGRDHLDCGSVASPNRETEAMLDGSDAVSDWPLLNAMINIQNGASWVSLHHGGGVGMGYSQHSGMVILCDGSTEMDKRLSLVLNSDPGMGLVRHLDAGYEEAENFIKHNKTKILFPSKNNA
jgi:urocanate hydratase